MAEPRPGWFRRWRDLLLLGAMLAGITLFVAWMRYEPPPQTVTLTISAGSLSSERARIAQALADEARDHGLNLRLVETAGSEEALKKLADPSFDLDLALIQGGLAMELTEADRVRQAAILHDEPLHLLVSGPELLEAISTRGLAALRGKSIDLNRSGTGSYRMALEVLAFADIKPEEYRAQQIPLQDLLRLNREELPDALFLISSLPSQLAEHLVQKHGYRLAPLPYAAAFARWRNDEGPGGIIHRQVREGIIPALTYDREPPVPAQNVPTLATRTLLMARTTLDPDIVERLVSVVFESPFRNFDDPALDPALLSSTPEVNWHEGALRYMQRNKPLIADDLLDIADKEVSLLAAVFGGLFCLGQWIQRRLRQSRDAGFESYIMKVAALEQQVLDQEVKPQVDLPTLLDLRRELLALKNEALERFAAGQIEGEQLMSGFLTQVNDARDHLTRLILHERDNLEEIARDQGRDARTLWREATADEAHPDTGSH